MLTPRRFARLLRQHGTDLAAWPPAEREGARRLMRWWPSARAGYLSALAADPELGRTARALDPARLAHMHAAVRGKLAAESAAAPLPTWFSPGLRWGALAACALLGMWIGWAEAQQPVPTLLAAVQLTPLSDPAP